MNGLSQTTEQPVPFASGPSEGFVDAWVLSGRDGSLLWHSDPLMIPGPPPEPTGRAEPGQPFEWEGTLASGTSATWFLRAECAPDDALFRCDRLLVLVEVHYWQSTESRYKGTGSVEMA